MTREYACDVLVGRTADALPTTTDEYALHVFGSADDVEYFDNVHVDLPHRIRAARAGGQIPQTRPAAPRTVVAAGRPRPI